MAGETATFFGRKTLRIADWFEYAVGHAQPSCI